MKAVFAAVAWIRSLSGWRAGLFAALAGGLGVFGHAPFHIWPAMMVAVWVLVLVLDGAVRRDNHLAAGFWRGWAFGFGHFLGGMFWVGNAFLVDADKFAALMPFAVSALPAGLALFWGAAGAVVARFYRPDAGQAGLLAVAFGVAEWARGHLLTGLPWNLPAYVWRADGWIAQAASLIGPYGISLVTLWMFASALMVSRPAGRQMAAFAAVAALGLCAHGAWRLGQSTQLATGPVVAAGQGGFTQAEVWDPANTRRIVDTYLGLLDTPQVRAADIVIWPEGAFPFLLAEADEVVDALAARLGDRTLVVGAVRRELTPDGERLHNSMLVMDTSGGGPTWRALYDKHHLVPFGEYLPFRPVFALLGLDSMVSYGGDMTPGPGPSLLAVGLAPLADARICYEIVFPGFNDANRARAGWILNVSIDAWYGDLLGPDQHFAKARWRAVESGLPVVRAASGGWSAVIDPYGRVIAAHRSGAGYASARLPAALSPTLYSRYGGNAFAALCLILLGFALYTTISVDTGLRVQDQPRRKDIS